MRIKLEKSNFSAIEGAFSVLKENKMSPAGREIIKKSLENSFSDYKFNITVVDKHEDNHKTFFVMSVFPEISVLDKIINAVAKNEDDKIIQKLWESTKEWTIEIDGCLLNPEFIDCTPEEFTAIVLHEVGHIVASNSIPNKISTILRYEVASASVTQKMTISKTIFGKLMSLPILDACISDSKKSGSNIKEEIKADTFAKKMGYSNALMTILTKISNRTRGASGSDKILKDSNFALETIRDLQARKDNLAKKSLFTLKESCESPFINSFLNEFIESVFETGEEDLFLTDKKTSMIQDLNDKKINDGLVEEFFLFGGKELKRIDPTELDYIEVKINEIKSENDRMMLISYIHSKIDLVEYYISILQNPSLSKKFSIPHSLDQLYAMKKRLLNFRVMTLKYKIPERNKGLLVAWPTGYEG